MRFKKHTYKLWKVIAPVMAIAMSMSVFNIAFAEETAENKEVAYGDINADEGGIG